MLTFNIEKIIRHCLLRTIKNFSKKLKGDAEKYIDNIDHLIKNLIESSKELQQEN